MADLDDDFMLNNIVFSKPKTQSTLKKADLKKQKYAKKIKDQRKRSAQKESSFSQNKIIDSLNSEANSSRQLFKREESEIKPKTQFKKQINVNTQNQDRQQIPSQQRNSRVEIKQKRSMQRPLKKVSLGKRPTKPGSINLKNIGSKVQQVTEILPEKDFSRIQKLDNAPIQQLELLKSVSDSLTQNGITKLTQIQTLSFASIFKRKDSIIKAATGSGKTLAYLIPLINQMLEQKFITKRQDGTTILVICPTRELCLQAQKEALRCLKRLPFIIPGCLVGGEQTNHQKSRIRKGIPLLFSTPGRLLYHLQNTQSFKLQNIKTIVFEEADRTLDMGFQATVSEILELMQKKLDFYTIQKILVSAHFNEKVQGLIKNLLMSNPQYIGFDSKKLQATETKQEKGETQQKDVEQIEHMEEEPLHQQQINTSSNLKQQYVLISEEEKIPFILSYISVLPQSKIMIFVSTISQVEFLDYLLNNIVYRDSNGTMTDEKIEKRRVYKIHGDLDQKLRTSTYFDFRKEKYAIMISTQVASRGLDFPDLSHIILFDIPPTITDYGNRIGRSGRFNSTGVSLLLLHYQQSDYAQKIRYYNKEKPLQNIDKDLIYEGFERFLIKINIRDNSLHYLEGIVRSMVKDDDEKYLLARKAYVSMLRAYARLKDKHIFHVKKLNLKMLSRTFGLNSAQAESRYNPNAKQSHFQTVRKKRKVESVRKLQVSQYL